MNINLTILAQLISFTIFVWFCRKYVWPPLIGAMQEREQQIADGLNAAEKAGQDLDQAKLEVAEQLDQAKQQAAQIIDQANKRAAQIVDEAKEQAITEGSRLKEAAQSDIAQEVNRAKEGLRSQVASLALAGAEKVLQAELRTLARPYAKAAFAVADEAGELQQWATQLNLLSSLAQQNKIAALISSPAIASAQQATQLAEVAGDLSSVVSNFLQVLAEHKRLALLPSVANLFADYKAERERRIGVSITSAFEVNSETSDRLSDALKNKLERDVDVEVLVDKDLIGGVIVRAGDIVIDASIRGRLAKLAEAMAV